jgi:hypothetical protein
MRRHAYVFIIHDVRRAVNSYRCYRSHAYHSLVIIITATSLHNTDDYVSPRHSLNSEKHYVFLTTIFTSISKYGVGRFLYFDISFTVRVCEE